MKYVYDVLDGEGKTIIPVSESIEDVTEKLSALFDKTAQICKGIVMPLALRQFSTFEWVENGEECWEANEVVSTQRLVERRS